MVPKSDHEVTKVDSPRQEHDRGHGGFAAAWSALFSLSFLPAWSALALAALIGLGSAYFSEPARLANLDVDTEGFPDSYLMLSKTEEGRGYLVNRRYSTIRRNRKKLPGRKWNIDRFGAIHESGLTEHWLLRSKRKGTIFFVPVGAIDDWAFPFYYDFVRLQHEDLHLSEVGWTQLFANRIYRGLYLRMALPFDQRKKDGGSGILREVLSVRGNQMTIVDTRFNADSRLYASCVASGLFPSLSDPSAALVWLDSRKPTEETVLLLNNSEPFEVSLLPLPISLNKLFEMLYGKLPPITEDERYRRWTAGEWTRRISSTPPLDRHEQFDAKFQKYKETFCAALKVHRRLKASAANSAHLRHLDVRIMELCGDE